MSHSDDKALKTGDNGEKDYWPEIFSFLENADREVFDSLRIFIDAPHLSKSFAVIAGNLIEIFQYIDSREVPELAVTMPRWLDYCRQIVLRKDEITAVIPDFCKAGEEQYKPPQKGAYGHHPLGVTLWCSQNHDEMANRYRILQANLCLAFHYLRFLEIKRKYKYESSKEAACLATRHLADPKHSASLRLLPDTPVSFVSYYGALTDHADDSLIKDLIPLFRYARSGKQGITHSREKNVHTDNPFHKTEQTFDLIEEEEDGDPERIKILKVRSGNRQQSAKQNKYLCSPDEFMTAGETFVIEQPGPDPSGGFDQRQQFMKAKGSLSAIVMQNQRLGNDWNRLTPHEVAMFLRGIDELAVADKDISGIPSAEVAAFLSISFWMSASPEVICECKWVPEPANSKVQLGIQWSKSAEQLYYWVIKPRTPVQEYVPAHKLKNQALPLSTRYALPIPAPARHAIGQHIDKLSRGKKPAALFNHDQKSYQAAAGEYLKILRQSDGGRQTLQRVSCHMHDLLARMAGSDVTVAMAITGREDILGAVPLFYTAHSVKTVNEIYSAACSTVLYDVGIEVSKDVKNENAVIKGADKIYVGSMYVPSRETVKRLIEDLKSRLNNARGKVSDNERNLPLQLHNDLTVYTIMMLGFATGYRAVHDPLLQAAEIDRSTGFAVISDKDDDKFHHSRIVWLPQICIEQLDLYWEHVEQLQKMLFLANQDLFFKVKEKATTGRSANRQNPSLFLMKSSISDLPVQPRFLERLVKTIDYQMPLNSNRHYLRTNLFVKRCPVEVINALMGHAERGNEPWGLYSGLSPLIYRQELARCLVPLLEKDGWRPEAGLTATGAANGRI